MSRAAGPGTVNYDLYRTLGAEYGVELRAEGARLNVRLHAIGAGTVRQEQAFVVPALAAPEFRMAVHQVSDEVVRWVTGTPGVAATRVLVLLGKRAYRVDSDGADVTAVTPAVGDRPLADVGPGRAVDRLHEVPRRDGPDRRRAPGHGRGGAR